MSKLKLVSKCLFAVLFVVSGFNHFFHTAFYLRIMPLYLPWQLPLVYLSGLLEIILGALLLVPKFTRAVGWGLIALLLAVFPANIHMAINHDLFPDYSPQALWLRLPLQFGLVAWAYCYTRTADRGK